MAAIDLAIKSLRKGETNLALAGGVNLLLHPFHSDILPHVIAPDGRCKTFDSKADGKKELRLKLSACKIHSNN